MNANTELLNFIYQNSQMGVDTVRQLMDITENADFQKLLSEHLEGYQKVHEKAWRMLNENGYDEKGLSAFEKIRTYLMVNIQTMKDHSASNIAAMLIQGSSMGITEAVQKLNRYEGETDKDIRKLMEELKKFEERNIEELKAYL